MIINIQSANSYFNDEIKLGNKEFILPRIGEKVDFANLFSSNSKRIEFTKLTSKNDHVVDILHSWDDDQSQIIEIIIGDYNDLNDFYNQLIK